MFTEKLKSLRGSRGINQLELARALGVARTTISGWERGSGEPNVEQIKQIAEYFKISADELLETEEKFIPVFDPETKQHAILIKKYRALDEHGKKMVDFTLTEEYNRLYPPIKSTRAEQRTIEIDFVDNALASAGIGELMGDVNREKISVPETPTTRRADFAIRVRGDSMEPDYYDDDIVLVHRTAYVPDGEIGIFVVDGETYIKKAGKNRLISINPEYDDIIGTEETEIYTMGLVIGKL